MFDDLNKTIKEGQERWEEIEEYTKRLKEHLESGRRIDMSCSLNDLATIVLRLVDYMRPMNPSKEQMDEATSGLADLLKTLKK